MDQYVPGPKQIVNRMGWAMSAMAATVLGIQYLVELLVYKYAPTIRESNWYAWVLTALSIVGIGLPVLYLISKISVPKAEKKEPKKLRITEFIMIFFICVAAMYLFNYFGIFIAFIISLAKGSDIINPLENVILNGNFLLSFLYGAIVGPIVEELMFRKLLLDRLRRLGDLPAILLTGIAFGLFHMNILQFFYASALGFIFAYVTIKTNRIRYSIILHMLINSIGIVVAPLVVKANNIGVMLVLATWVFTAIAVGCTFFALNIKKVRFEKAEETIARKSSYFLNPGTIVFCLITVAMTIYQIMVL